MAPSPRPIPPVLGATAAPLTDDDLDSVLHVGDPDRQPTPAAQAFTVTDDGAAEWCMRHVRKIKAQLADYDTQRDEWYAEIDRWHDTVARPLEASLAFFEGHLARYAIDKRLADPKAKTLQLPSGTVSTTGKTPVVDFMPKTDAAVIAWLRDTFPQEVLDAMEPIKVHESVLKTGLRNLVVIFEQVFTVDDEGDLIGDPYWRPMLNEKGKEQPLGPGQEVRRRVAVPPVNPATGEAWPDDVPIEDRAAPCLLVTAPSVEATVKPAPVLS